jgi:hypothetical protein
LYTINLTWAGLGMNSGFRGDRPATHRLSHGTAPSLDLTLLQSTIQSVPRSKHTPAQLHKPVS